jgi:hypothetical protein
MHEEKIGTIKHSMVLSNIVTSMMRAQSVFVAIRLGIADLLRDGQKSITELAQVTGTHGPSLYRLLRALASINIFTEVEKGFFANTLLSTALQSDNSSSLSAEARMWADEYQWKTWGELAYSIKTGEPAFNHLYGIDIWEFFEKVNPQSGQLFNEAMSSFSGSVNDAIAAAYDFSPFHTFADIGGGTGSLLTTLLIAFPKLRGILFERFALIERAKERIVEEVVARCTFIAGDFFQGIPINVDACILKQVLHDWSNEQCVRILRNCRIALAVGGKVLVIERIIQPENLTSFTAFLDLHMLVTFSGCERTVDEFRLLYEASGFNLTRIIPISLLFSIIEGVAV